MSSFFADEEIDPWEEGKNLYLALHKSVFEDLARKLSEQGFPVRIHLDLDDRCVRLICSDRSTFFKIKMHGNFNTVYEAIIIATSSLAEDVKKTIFGVIPKNIEVKF